MSYLRYWFLSLAINTCYLQHLHYWQWLFGEISFDKLAGSSELEHLLFTYSL